jgi:uncharacterized cupredoxin-like copper-binding protein
MRFAYVAAALVTAVSLQARADGPPGHAHAPAKGLYDGHAAVMGEPGDAKARGIRTIEVTMSDEMRFRPTVISVTRGQTVKFVVKNTGQLKHEFVLGSGEELTAHAAEMEKFPEMEHDDPNSIAVEPGKTGAVFWKFTKAGTWDIGFGCLLPGHFTAGMKGKVVVQ